MGTVLQDAEAKFDTDDADLKAKVLVRKDKRKSLATAQGEFDTAERAVNEASETLVRSRDAVKSAVDQETTDAAVEPADPVPPEPPAPVDPEVDPNADPVVPPVDPNAPVV